MLMEETKAAARARLSGRVEGVRPPPISTRPPTAVSPDTHIQKKKKNNIQKIKDTMSQKTQIWYGLLTWDGVGDRHEGWVQSRGHAPHSVVSHNPSQAEGGDHLSEGCVGGDDAQSQTGGNTCRETQLCCYCCAALYGKKCAHFVICSVLFLNFTAMEQLENKNKHFCVFPAGYASVVIHSFSEASKKLT